MRLRKSTDPSLSAETARHQPIRIHLPAVVHLPHRDRAGAENPDRDAALRTEQVLRRLPERRWTVLEGSDHKHGLDHIVVGPAGVFAITSRKPEGPGVRVQDGVLWLRKGEDRRASRPGTAINRCALDAARALERDIRSRSHYQVEVHPLVVLWCEFPQAVAESTKITFVHGRDLLGWLSARDPALDEQSSAQIAQTVRMTQTSGRSRGHVRPRGRAA
jgi:nuclease-like protein